MSVNLSIKEVPDEIAERLRARAARNHRSLQGELMAIVEQAAAESRYPTAVFFQRGTKTIEQIADEAKFSSLDMDSLDSVEFIMEIEDRFEIEISDEEAEKVTTVAEAAALVDKLLALKG